MFERAVLDIEDALRIADVTVQIALRDGYPPIAVAVVDDNGDLVAFLRMDDTSAFQRDHAMKKAYTSARLGLDLVEFAAYRADHGLRAADFGDERLVGAGRGGVVMTEAHSGSIVGAIGVEGAGEEYDEQLARIGAAEIRSQSESSSS